MEFSGMKKAKCLVTGGSGFIGSHIIDKLKERDYQIFNFDRVNGYNICNWRMVHNIIDRYDPDVVFHLAGILGTSELMQKVLPAEKINVQGTLNVLDVCATRKIPIVFASKLNPPDWINPYTITKQACDAYCKMYQQQWQAKICILKPLNVYGPRQKPHPVQKYVPTFIDRAFKNESLPVWGTGQQFVDPVYVNDVAEAFVRAWEKERWGLTIEIGLGSNIPVLEVAETVLELIQSESKIEFLPMRPGEPEPHAFPVIANTHNMEKFLNIHPKRMFNLVDGLTETISWWKKHAVKDG